MVRSQKELEKNIKPVSAGRTIVLLLLMLSILLFGIYVGGHPASLPGPLRSLLVDDQVAVQAEALDDIENRYYKKVDLNDLEAGSLNGMVDSLDDRFSLYMGKNHYTLFKEDTSGKFSGIGMVVGENKRGLHVSEVFKGSPAKKSGIRVGDVIVAVNGRSIKGEKVEVAVAKIKGKAGTKVRLTYIDRKNKRQSVRIERETIDVPLAESRIFRRGGDKLGVVRLSKFSNGATTDVASEIKSLKKRGAVGFVFDLRGNPGGLLNESISVASLFIKKGVIASTKGRKWKTQVFRASGDAVLPKAPMVTLVDGHTASAAEIVTGALKDDKRATIVGRRTFGKGVIQELLPLSNGGALDLTVGRYFTPDGTDLGGKGIKPNVVVKKDASEKQQLNTALTVLGKKVR